MPDEIVINTTAAEVPATEQQVELTEAILESGEKWQQQFSEAVSAMLGVVAEVRASNSETATLRAQVEQLLSTNRDLTQQIAQQSAQSMEALTRLTLVVTPPNPMHHSEGSPTVTPVSVPQAVEQLPAAAVVIEPEAVPASPARPKRRAI